MGILCKLRGHLFPTDSQWGKPYLKIEATSMDGIGRIHAYLTTECDRCGAEYHVANVHLPAPRAATGSESPEKGKRL